MRRLRKFEKVGFGLVAVNGEVSGRSNLEKYFFGGYKGNIQERIESDCLPHTRVAICMLATWCPWKTDRES